MIIAEAARFREQFLFAPLPSLCLGEGFVGRGQTLPGRSFLTADPPKGRVKQETQLQNLRFGLV